MHCGSILNPPSSVSCSIHLQRLPSAAWVLGYRSLFTKMPVEAERDYFLQHGRWKPKEETQVLPVIIWGLWKLAENQICIAACQTLDVFIVFPLLGSSYCRLFSIACCSFCSFCSIYFCLNEEQIFWKKILSSGYGVSLESTILTS